MRNAEQTALLIALLVKRSNERRVRVSETTVKVLSGRQRLRSAFVVNVSEQLASNHGLCMIEIDIGGFGIFHFKSLEGAKSATVKRLFSDGEKKLLRDDQDFDWEAVNREIGYRKDGEDFEDTNEEI